MRIQILFSRVARPPLRRRRFGNLSPPLLAHLLRPRLPTLPAKLLGSLILAVVVGRFLDLAGGDPGHGDGSADHIGGA